MTVTNKAHSAELVNYHFIPNLPSQIIDKYSRDLQVDYTFCFNVILFFLPGWYKVSQLFPEERNRTASSVISLKMKAVY